MTDLLVATYRLQLNGAFTFDDAAGVTDYLGALGVSHVYCSPILQAAPGSTHGYDVTDPTRVNGELGGEAAFERFRAALRRNGLELLLDAVPNHMAIGGRENPWWQDVLENGRASRYAGFFDVDWDGGSEPGRVLLPVLGDHIGRVLDAGQIQLGREGGAFEVRYFERRFPVSVASMEELLSRAAEACGSEELAGIARRCGELGTRYGREADQLAQIRREQAAIRDELTTLLERKRDVARGVDDVVAGWNTNAQKAGEMPATPAGALERLLSRQHYRLAFWRMAGEELGYRRFFDVNSLIGLRVEDEEVFAASHALVLRWLHDGVVHGLRIDHPDGLRDPEGYLRRLRAAAPRGWIVVEKILELGETLPRWPVEGTTGYDFLNEVGGLFVDPAAERAMTDFYRRFTGQEAVFAAVVHEKKLLVLRDVLGSDVNRLVELLRGVCRRHPRHRDYTRRQLAAAVRELAACFPVYRTYVRNRPRQVSGEDERHICEAVEAARRHRPDLDPELFAFLRELLLLNVEGPLETEFAMRFQQLTGPAMAKGVEDTAFYCFNRLVSLNEVGGDPGRFGVSTQQFHEFCGRMQREWPRTMLATSTHDTKRGEDVRARICLLSERPDAWVEAVLRWAELNARHRRGDWPDANAEYLLYQTLFGAWPIDRERLAAYMRKAAREAKEHTTWTDPNPEYEAALEQFVAGVLGDERFMADFQTFVVPFIRPGRINSLSQTLLKLTAPGVPDVYQGTELWNLSLVDPDNRRPVDYELRRRLLAKVVDGRVGETGGCDDDGRGKLWVIRQGLAVRRRFPEALGPAGAYRPIEADGEKARHVVALVRGEQVVTVVPRLVLGLEDGWGGTAIRMPEGLWRNELTSERVSGGELQLAELMKQFPVALLSREAG